MEPLDSATDTKAEKELGEYLAEHRKKLPAIPRSEFEETVQRLETLAESPEVTATREAKAAKQALLRERAMRQAALAKLIESAGVRYAECLVENFRITHAAQRKVVKAVGEYLDLLRDTWESTGLILYGKIGTGKDHLAMAVAKQAIELGKRVAWVNGQWWFGEVRDAIDENTPEASLISALVVPDLLVLSDPLPPAMGRGDELTQYQSAMLYRVIDARYSRGRVTVVTVNVNDDAEADRRMGEAVWDRMCHGAWKVYFDWPTYRKPAKQVL